MTERLYALVRVRAGDYLLPGNDGRTLWRIASYGEDGSAAWRDARGRWRTVTGTYWMLWRFRRSVENGVPEHVDPLEWDEWDSWESGFATRAAAVDRAVKLSSASSPTDEAVSR